ncbi:CRISPR-associated endoribonuclease Cas6 [Thermosyntropha lipolytica DSM 11003]|uniref:CRISPR-associated endoribonuclease Cas6 n=1 Tax=Thermosyntropha lipolytica DSM 11003 TaxID=1123382 RepID=A0A1M5RL26_9FIRM|nr:CRISPR system precrRNA processing endoribonuclease RAMP protein Cas6 [Thermosyntropha lipolytica]SHH26994.1 CRISPR-associated endoribonuclease Cas6 [Thermosyntropha lipolytica DSM 11003]
MQIAHLEITLAGDEKGNIPSYQMGSLFHGWLMERVSPDYARLLHQSEMKPFSQYVEKKGQEAIWHISALDRTACQEIIVPLLEEDFSCIEIRHKKEVFKAGEKKLVYSFASYKELADRYYLESTPSRVVKMEMVTPVSFRSGGEYQIFPSLHLIYQNLINRWNQFADKVSLEEKNLAATLAEHSFISGYRLETRYFPLEKIFIPAFAGRMSIKIAAPSPMVALINMLLGYSAFSGLGIKTSLGMGGVRVIEEKRGEWSGKRQAILKIHSSRKFLMIKYSYGD